MNVVDLRMIVSPLSVVYTTKRYRMDELFCCHAGGAAPDADRRDRAGTLVPVGLCRLSKVRSVGGYVGRGPPPRGERCRGTLVTPSVQQVAF